MEKRQRKRNRNFHIIPTEKAETFRSLSTKNESSNHILSLLGYKINIAEQINQFEQKLQKFLLSQNLTMHWLENFQSSNSDSCPPCYHYWALNPTPLKN